MSPLVAGMAVIASLIGGMGISLGDDWGRGENVSRRRADPADGVSFDRLGAGRGDSSGEPKGTTFESAGAVLGVLAGSVDTASIGIGVWRVDLEPTKTDG